MNVLLVQFQVVKVVFNHVQVFNNMFQLMVHNVLNTVQLYMFSKMVNNTNVLMNMIIRFVLLVLKY